MERKHYSFENLPSKHDQATNRVIDERDYVVFINKKGILDVGTADYVVRATKCAS